MATQEELLSALAQVEASYDTLGTELEKLRVLIEGDEPPPPPPPPPGGLEHPVEVGTGNLWFRRGPSQNVFPVTVTARWAPGETLPDGTTSAAWHYELDAPDGAAAQIHQGRLGLTEEEVDR